MRMTSAFAAAGVAASLVGCGKAECPQSGPCEITVSHRILDWYGADPDTMLAPPGAILVWKFDDPQYLFNVKAGDYANRDRVDFPAAAPQIDGCWVTDDPTGLTPRPLATGKYFRCEVRRDAGMYNVPYRILFRGADNVQRVVDPTVTNTGHPILLSALPGSSPTMRAAAPSGSAVASATAIPVTLAVPGTTPSVLPEPAPVPASADQIVIWTAPSGYEFEKYPTGGGSGDALKLAGADHLPCFITNDGVTSSDTGTSYMCTIFQNVPGGSYEITFHEKNKKQFTASGTLAR